MNNENSFMSLIFLSLGWLVSIIGMMLSEKYTFSYYLGMGLAIAIGVIFILYGLINIIKKSKKLLK